MGSLARVIFGVFDIAIEVALFPADLSGSVVVDGRVRVASSEKCDDCEDGRHQSEKSLSFHGEPPGRFSVGLLTVPSPRSLFRWLSLSNLRNDVVQGRTQARVL